MPLDPTESAKTRADGKPEMATAAECGLEEGEADKSLCFYDPTRKEEDVWRPAVHAQLPLRDTVRRVVENATRKTLDEGRQGIWSRSASTWPPGSFPERRFGVQPGINGMTDAAPEGSSDPLEVLRRVAPPYKWLRSLCRDARDLVIGCAAHTCSPSRWKFHSKGARIYVGTTFTMSLLV